MIYQPALSETKRAAIDEFIRELMERYGDRVKRVILFGSVARGDIHSESDIDVLIIGSLTLDDVISISYPILLKYGELISPHIMSEEHYSMLKSRNSGFIKSVEREGIVLV
ncbi:MAG: nucleotidyltransferase domain-containing protein [Archaeoglobi archaeon]|nr:nucleotidyltransferase domain-containing protein [Archaeoglobi archaeon]